MLQIRVCNRQSALPIDRRRIVAAVRSVLDEADIRVARISVAVVDDAESESLNRRFLEHEGPADVLSFPLSEPGGPLEGEIVVSAETAIAAAPKYRMSADAELLLYVIHGTLHLVGFDDLSRADRAAMRAAERRHLAAVLDSASRRLSGTKKTQKPISHYLNP